MKLKKLLANLIVPLKGGGIIDLFPLSCICEDKNINIEPSPTPTPTPITPKFVQDNLTQILNFGLTNSQVNNLLKVQIERDDVFEFDSNIVYYGNININKTLSQLKNQDYILVNYIDCDVKIVLKKVNSTATTVKFKNINDTFTIDVSDIDGTEYASAVSGTFFE